MPKFVVAEEYEIPINSRKLVTVKGRPIAIFNVDGEYYGILDRCPHQGGSLCEGKLIGQIDSSGPGDYQLSRQGEIIRCPWHGWEFDLKTGKSRCRPDTVKVRKFEVSAEKVNPDEELIEAETFKVSVEGKYIIVEF